MSQNKDSWRDRRRSILLTAGRLGAMSLEEFEAGEWAYRVQSDKSAYWHFRSLEAAKAMAECLVRMDGTPGSRQSFRRWSGRIDCFETLVWPDVGPIPTRLFVWCQELGDWTETWSGMAPAGGAALASRTRRTPTTAQMM